MRVLDVNDDYGASLAVVAAQVGLDNLSDTVKTAQWLDPAVGRDRDFALILVDGDGSCHRKYACHDPGNTVVSMFYLEQAQQHLNPAAIKVAAANLSRIARDWGLEVPAEVEKMAARVLPEGAERDVIDERRVHYRPPKLASAGNAPSGPFAKLASVKKNWHALSPQERRAVALDLVKEASTAPIQVPPEIYRYSGPGLSPKFAAHMQTRRAYCADEECAAGYDFLSKTASLFPPENVLDALYALDEVAHLRWAGGDRYSEKLADPVLAVYERVKEAAYVWTDGAEHVTEHDLVMFRVSADARTHFTNTFTDALWERFDRDPVGTFKGLPREQKILLSRLARAE